MKTRKINPTKLNLFVDIIIALAFAVMMEEEFTGLRIHEVLGLAIAAGFATHILLHWRWVVSITKTFFANLFHPARLNYVINVVLFVDMVTVIVTGILISKTLGLSFGGNGDGLLHPIHLLASYLVLVIVGLHVALHWKWLVTNSQKYLFNFHLPGRKPKTVSRPVVLADRSSRTISSEGN